MLTGALAKAALLILVFVVAAFLGLRKYHGGNLADALMEQADEDDEEILDTLIRREAEVAAAKRGVSLEEAESAIRQEWDEGKLQIQQGALHRPTAGRSPPPLDDPFVLRWSSFFTCRRLKVLLLGRAASELREGLA
jgi:hypothetical protein